MLRDRRAPLHHLLQVQYTNFVTMDLHDDFDDAHVMHAFSQWARTQRNDEELARRIHELEILHEAIDTQNDSIAALCGALLQIAKQGISTVFGGLGNYPTGCQIGAETLKNIVWQGRNQSIHYEEGRPHPAVRECFENLAQLNAVFSLVHDPNRNMAGQIVRLLEWTKYETYERDTTSLLG